MWISKEQYDFLQSDNATLRRDSDILQSILTAISKAKDGGIAVGDAIVMSYDTWSNISAQWQADKDALMKLTAERDWYKQKYAELIIASEGGN